MGICRLVEEAKANMETIMKDQDDETKLALYSYGRHGKEGDCTEENPGDADPIAAAKWEGWNGLKGTSQEEAQAKFIELAKKVLGKWDIYLRISTKKILIKVQILFPRGGTH